MVGWCHGLLASMRIIESFSSPKFSSEPAKKRFDYDRKALLSHSSIKCDPVPCNHNPKLFEKRGSRGRGDARGSLS